ncbi:MAG TPA: Rieske 2Fe-2S domain-containing protein [Verrucomicrobiae bacterium]|nr:Rieske 2Fe-2S domain-containing protein [Verrucomicrobiae bacterium]
MTRLKIARVDEVPEGGTVKFPFMHKGRHAEGFVARFQGKLVAYENRCQHLPVRLDFPDAKLFNRDGTHFICQNHNAIYEPSTGLCVRGPCEGQTLRALEIQIVQGEVWVLV